VKPVIGISAYCEQARWGVWDLRATLLPQTYLDAVAGAGGVPVLLPPMPPLPVPLRHVPPLVRLGRNRSIRPPARQAQAQKRRSREE